MIGLFFSYAILFVVAALLGFAIGWRACVAMRAAQRREEERAIDHLRRVWGDAQARRARSA